MAAHHGPDCRRARDVQLCISVFVKYGGTLQKVVLPVRDREVRTLDLGPHSADARAAMASIAGRYLDGHMMSIVSSAHVNGRAACASCAAPCCRFVSHLRVHHKKGRYALSDEPFACCEACHDATRDEVDTPTACVKS